MDSNEEIVQERVVVNNPSQRIEGITATYRGPRKSGLSTGTIAIFAIFALIVIAAVVYVVVNKNASESDWNANLEVASQAEPPAVMQQPAQAPVIIQQPAPAQAPVIIQQPVPSSLRENTSANDDANLEAVATTKLAEYSDMAAVVMTVTDARAVLIGTVNSEATKAKAELIVKSVRGMKSVGNRIVVSGE